MPDPGTASEQPPQANSSHSNPDTDAGLTLELAAYNPLQSLLTTSTFVTYSLIVIIHLVTIIYGLSKHILHHLSSLHNH